MQLANARHAFVDMARLRDYCLNPLHETGKHKAHEFASVLGLTVADAGQLRNALLEAARSVDAIPGKQDAYGQR